MRVTPVSPWKHSDRALIRLDVLNASFYKSATAPAAAAAAIAEPTNVKPPSAERGVTRPPAACTSAEELEGSATLRVDSAVQSSLTGEELVPGR